MLARDFTLPVVLVAIHLRRQHGDLLAGRANQPVPGLTAFRETLEPLRLAAFVAIRAAIGVSCLDPVRPRAASA